ncbi:MAG: polysaccharide biosynthesis tyrosine autokinase [Actinomycetota bacterium]
MAAPASPNEEFTLLDYASIVRRRLPWVLLPASLLVLLATTYTVNAPPSYEAVARVLLADSAAQRTLDPSSQNTGFLTREMSNEISLASSDAVESLVTEELGDLPEVSISAESAADVLVFRASAGTAEEAALNANTWAEQYVVVKQNEAVANITAATTKLQSRLETLRAERQELREPLDTLDTRIANTADPEVAASLQRQYDRLADDLRYELELVTGQAEATVASLNELELQAELSAVGEARIIQVAAPPETPSNAPLSRNIPLALVVGLMLGVAVALLIDARDNTIKSPADIAAMTDLPLLAAIPQVKRSKRTKIELACLVEPEGVFADSYHKLRSALEFLSFDRTIASIMVTSANASEGKSTTSANLALALSSVGKRTLLVDVDFRRARVHDIFGIDQTPGLSDFVLAGAAPETIAQRVGGHDSNLWAVPTGSTPPNPASFVGTPGFLNTIDWLAHEADIAVFDAPPLLAVSEAHSLGKHVDVVILTAMAGKTTRSQLAEVITELRQSGANVAGVVLIGVAEADSYARHREYYTTNKAWRSAPAPQLGPVSSPVPGRQRTPADAAIPVGDGDIRLAATMTADTPTNAVDHPSPDTNDHRYASIDLTGTGADIDWGGDPNDLSALDDLVDPGQFAAISDGFADSIADGFDPAAFGTGHGVNGHGGTNGATNGHGSANGSAHANGVGPAGNGHGGPVDGRPQRRPIRRPLRRNDQDE